MMLPKRFQAAALAVCLTLPCIRDLGATELCPIFSEAQKDVLQNAYDFGKEHGVGWTMAAIAWKESSAGKYPVNWNDPSFGTYHVLLKNAADSEGFDPNKEPLRALSVAARLIYDHDYSANESLKVIRFWQKQHKNDWSKVWASYNAGWNWSGPTGQAYSKDLHKKMKYLQSNSCVTK